MIEKLWGPSTRKWMTETLFKPAGDEYACACGGELHFPQYEADTRRSRLFVFIWWQLTAVFPFNKIRLKKLVVHSLICHLTEGATWGRPYPIHSERLIRDSLIHRGQGSALTACTCTKQQMDGWLVSVPKKPPLSFPFIRGPQHICRQLLSHFLFSCLIKRGHKVTWTMASHHQHVCVCVGVGVVWVCGCVCYSYVQKVCAEAPSPWNQPFMVPQLALIVSVCQWRHP